MICAPRSPTSIPSRPSARATGFTLIELLVVILVIALAGAAVVLTLPASGPAPVRAADRLTGALAEAAREAVTAGTAMGIRIDQRGYRFVQAGPAGWQPVFDPPMLAPARWPAGVRVSVERLGLDLGTADPPANVPAFWFEPFGTAEAATIHLSSPEGRARIEIGADGRIRMGVGDG